jgi:hypothetical protein
LDEIAESVATVLRFGPEPEPFPVDLWNQSPVEAAFLVRAVIDTCARTVTALSCVRVANEVADILDGDPDGSEGEYEGVLIERSPELQARLEFFRFNPAT